MKTAIGCRVSTERQEQDGTILFFGNLDDFVTASEAAENPDLAFWDTEMLCQ